MGSQMSSRHVELLLEELCVALGFCLAPDANARLRTEPPMDVDEFTDALIRAAGLDPSTDIPIHLRRDVRTRVADHFRRAEDSQ